MTAPSPVSTMPAIRGPSANKDNGGLEFLEVAQPVWTEHHEHWDREEIRLYGGDPALGNLLRFDWEDTKGVHFKGRKAMAHYINLPRIHASLVTGHVGKKRPKPGAGLDFGSLGDVRAREEQTGTPTRAEMLYYNADGIGQDGKEWAVWWDGVYERSEATGHRWVMVEVPRVDPDLQTILTLNDELSGARPFLVEYSPIRVTNWWYHNGELQFAVIRPTVDEPYLHNNTLLMPQLDARGYYLLVREGCDLLGPDFVDGGWWLWDSQRSFIDSGDWSRTGGRIPLFPVFSEADPGTDTHPAISRSQTMEIGQCADGILNLTSARDFDAFNAASSKLYVLGGDETTMASVADGKDSQIVCVPPVKKENGDYLVPTLYDGSQGAVTEAVFKSLIPSKFDEAQRTMIERATASQDSSGAKQAGSFAEASSPLLVRRARYHQQAESEAIYFAELRWGTTKQPSGYAVYPDDYELAPIIDDIDAMFDTLRRAAPANSPSLTVSLLEQAIDERGVNPKDVPRATIKKELEDSIAAAAAAKAAITASAGLNNLATDKPGGPPPPASLPPVTPPGGNAEKTGANPPTTVAKGAAKPKPAKVKQAA